eukprot:TRINITY_DN3456_c0_g1_i1.p1 TRINITY_DN3456_c0_g1~~TRINITY_DN3456_c0_g1_i1.p1  ORF type:complete len:446 (+),score=71.67 TRINITY_DN3456_c0_g1_i1:145-1482(+)
MCIRDSSAYGVNGLENGLGRTPPLGWSSWNYFAENVTESLILATADAMVATGLAGLGFEYVNIDAGYLLPTRHPTTSKLQVDPSKFPRGLRFVADQLHSKGLKLGVYTDIGQGSCGKGPGSYGHYDLDAATIAHDWTADYLKVDYCGKYVNVTPASEQWAAWHAFGEALNSTGRPIYYSTCPRTPAPKDGTAAPFNGNSVYSPPIAWTAEQRSNLANSLLVEYENNFDLWYSPTIPAGDGGPIPYPGGFLTNIDAVLRMSQLNYSGPGSWNDLDMLQMCTYGEGATRHYPGGMSLVEYRSHLAVWAVLASPLIHSADLRTVGARHADCLDIMLNPEVIAVNQDQAALAPWVLYQGFNSSISRNSPTIVEQAFGRKLVNGTALVLFNRSEQPSKMVASMVQMRLPLGQQVRVRDVLSRRDLPDVLADSFETVVPAHGVVFVVFHSG